jgi:RES domain-containing protein
VPSVWRIARRRYALDRTGKGAHDEGGRWNLPGTAVIYAGRTIGIAALERLVHLADIVPPDLVLVRIDLPDNSSTEQVAAATLPPDWDAVPIAPRTMEFGTRWAQESRSLVLYVPSALIHEETNAVLNPNHPEFVGVKMTIERDFHYDGRLFALQRARRRP